MELTTIDNLLCNFDFANVESKRDDIPGKILITFKTPIQWWDEKARIFQFVALYDTNTRIVKALKIYGFDLKAAIDYANEYHYYLWCPIIHYVQDIYCSTPSVTFICSL